MPEILSLPTNYRRVNASIQDNNVEDLEIDFNISGNRGVEIFSMEFDVAEIVFTTGSNLLNSGALLLAIHNRTGNLDDLSPGADVDDDDSEIMAYATVLAASQEEAATRGGSAVTIAKPKMLTNFMEELGRPLLVAGNLTFRAEATIVTGTITWNGVQVTIRYRHVLLTLAELARAFIARGQ